MPQMIPVVGALFTGTGLFASGGAIAATLGGGLIGGTIAGAIGGALVGAAFGGLTSLVMGGDIGKGILFGAIGGAVTGGIGGFMDAQAFQAASITSKDGASMLAGSDAAFAQGDFSYSEMAEMNKNMGSQLITKGVGEGTEKVVEGGLVGKLGEAGTSALIEGGIGFVGSTMAGMAEEERWQAEMDAQIAEAEKSRQHEMEMLQAKLSADSSSSGSSSDRDWAAELAENRRQFNAELSQRKEEFAGTMGIRKQELYAPMEYQTEARERAGGALASVSVNRGEYKQSDSINKQVQAATEYPDPVIPAQPEVA